MNDIAQSDLELSLIELPRKGSERVGKGLGEEGLDEVELELGERGVEGGKGRGEGDGFGVRVRVRV
jgi:hypothetical protein